MIAGQWWDSLSLCKAQEAHGTVLPSRFGGAHERPRLSGGRWPTEPYCLGGLLGRSSVTRTISKVRTAPRERQDFIKPEGISGSGLQVKVLYKKDRMHNLRRAHRSLAATPAGSSGPRPTQPAAPASAGSGFRGNSGKPALPLDTLLP